MSANAVPRRSIRALAVFAAVVGVLLLALTVYVSNQAESPVETKPDEQKPFRIAPDEPYEVNFHAWEKPSGAGRGIIIKQHQPAVVRERSGDRDPEGRYAVERTATFTLPPASLAKLLRAVEDRGVMNLQGSYTLRGATDGPQMKLFIRQGERVKRVECSNYFPDELKAFADDLKALVEPHLAAATWATKKAEGD